MRQRKLLIAVETAMDSRTQAAQDEIETMSYEEIIYFISVLSWLIQVASTQLKDFEK